MVNNNVYRQIEPNVMVEGLLKLPEHSVQVPTKIKHKLTEEKHDILERQSQNKERALRVPKFAVILHVRFAILDNESLSA